MKTTIAFLGFILMITACQKNELPGVQNDKSTQPTMSAAKNATAKWATTNLSVTRYRNGDIIPEVQDPAAWAALTTGAWCWYNNDPANSAYGRLYNWYAVNDPRGLAPKGYHVATNAEWDQFSAKYGGDALSGGSLKATGTVEGANGLWYAPNTGATNSSGFSGLPGGKRSFIDNSFVYNRYIGYYWSSTENSSVDAWNRQLNFNSIILDKLYSYKQDGMSVRCIKD